MADKISTVLIVDDSSVVRLFIRSLIAQASGLKVIGEATNGKEALEMTKILKPDVITMDIRMPEMDGFLATRAIMEQCPTPIVVVSSSINDSDLNIAYNALQAGALAILEKPVGIRHPNFEQMKQELISNLKLMSQVSVVRRRVFKKLDYRPQISVQPKKSYRAIGIAASTGGPQAIRFILEKLPHDFPVPLLIVQHMAKGFIQGMLSWLNKVTKLEVKFAEDDEKIKPGNVYFSTDDYHLAVKQGMKIALFPDPPQRGFRPSANILFQSLADNIGMFAIGVILSGMGDDGSLGLKKMEEQGASTIAQDEESSIVFGMPRAAIEVGAIKKVVPLIEIPATLMRLVSCDK